MSRSSGQGVVETETVTFMCDEDDCEFVGKVTAWYDPELNKTGWECPACGFEETMWRGR